MDCMVGVPSEAMMGTPAGAPVVDWSFGDRGHLGPAGVAV
jgi:hypothetical protein